VRAITIFSSNCPSLSPSNAAILLQVPATVLAVLVRGGVVQEIMLA
jgi:hypothetical protein